MKEFDIPTLNSKLRYLDLPGEKMPIIFIHGLGCTASYDYPEIVSMDELCGHRRILVDLLGSGYSDKPADYDYQIESHANSIKQLITHLGFDRVFLFAHSMGGAVALSLAKQIQDKLSGIILTEANLDSGGGFFSKKIAAYTEEEYVTSGHHKLVQMTKRAGNSHWAASMSVSSPLAIHRTAVSLVEGVSPSWREIFYSLEVPRAFVFGDQSLPDPDHQELSKQGIEVFTIPNAGHSMAWDNPHGLSQVVAEFAQKLE